jgi:predicted permease
MEILSKLTIPLILFIIGYGLKLKRSGLKKPLLVIGARLCLLIPTALLLNKYFIRSVLHLDFIFEAALFTFLILPPPFIIPLYIEASRRHDLEYTNNTLMLHTLVSIVVFIAFLSLQTAL